MGTATLLKIMCEGNNEIRIMTEEDYLAIHGAGRQEMGESALHKNKGNNSDKVWKKLVERQAAKDRELCDRRQQLREEYYDLVLKGEIRQPTRFERLIAIANGHPDNASVQAARTILERENINWQI